MASGEALKKHKHWRNIRVRELVSTRGVLRFFCIPYVLFMTKGLTLYDFVDSVCV